jgi:prevent-host-death family protein
MHAVGVRQLKNGLTRYLRLVEKGESLLVTNRNRIVAILKKPDRQSARTPDEKVAALVAEGKLLPAKEPGPFRLFKPIAVKGKPVSTMIIEERR